MMKTRIYKLEFTAEVHFGNGVLDHCVNTLCADTLFSALCIEAAKSGRLDSLYQAFKEDHLFLSDGFPFKKDRLYLPKPVMYIDRSSRDNQDSKDSVAQRKKFKNLKYIALDLFYDYLRGEDIFVRNDLGSGHECLGRSSLRTKNAVRNGTAETLPYHVGTFKFAENYGLYFILRYDSEDKASLVDSLFRSLALTGIGGKRSAGLGRFNLQILKDSAKEVVTLDKMLNTQPEKDRSVKMLLSVALPKEPELPQALEGRLIFFRKGRDLLPQRII